jgi:hypothetical protein
MSLHPLPPSDQVALRPLPPLDDRAGPARRISAAHAQRLVAAALEARAGERGDAPLARRLAVAAALALALASAASAAYVLGRARPAAAPAAGQMVPPAPPAHLAPAGPEAAAAPLAPVRAHAPVPVAAPAGHPATAEDRLRLANQLRARGLWRAAERAYRRAAAGPGAGDASAATVAAASLRLEHLDDAPGARALYLGVLRARPAGALAEEARWGVVEAERRLGDRQAEARALRDFIARHPGSLQRPRAEGRLAELAP